MAREKIAAAFGEDGHEYLKHDDAGDDSVGPADLGSLLSSGRHVEPDEKLKSAARIASQFNADSVSDLLDFAHGDDDAGAEGGGGGAVNVDLSKVITGDASMEPVAPSKGFKAAASIARQFGGDGAMAGRLAHDLTSDTAAHAPRRTGFGRNFVSIYKKLMAGQPVASSHAARSRAARARAPAPSGALPINTNAVQRALEPRAAHAPESGRQAWLEQWAKETRDETHVADGEAARRPPRRGSAAREAAGDSGRAQQGAGAPAHGSPRQADQAGDINSLWNKLLDEEAEAKAAKHEAAQAKKQAASAARKIEAREAASRRAAAKDREEATMRADEARAARDKRDSLIAERKADQAAHLLARRKFAQMQRAKQPPQGAVARPRGVREGAAAAKAQGAAGAAAAAADEQAATRAAAAQQRARAAAATAASAPTAATTASHRSHAAAAVGAGRKGSRVPRRRQPAVAEARRGGVTGSPRGGRGQEATIVATVKKLEQNAEAEPVVTRAQRSEQQAEIREAKQLLHQAAALKKRRAIKASIARQVPLDAQPYTLNPKPHREARGPQAITPISAAKSPIPESEPNS